jgi:hypothetical protein
MVASNSPCAAATTRRAWPFAPTDASRHLRGRAAGGPRTGSVRLAATSILRLGLPPGWERVAAKARSGQLAGYLGVLGMHAGAACGR